MQDAFCHLDHGQLSATGEGSTHTLSANGRLHVKEELDSTAAQKSLRPWPHKALRGHPDAKHLNTAGSVWLTVSPMTIRLGRTTLLPQLSACAQAESRSCGAGKEGLWLSEEPQQDARQRSRYIAREWCSRGEGWQR